MATLTAGTVFGALSTGAFGKLTRRSRDKKRRSAPAEHVAVAKGRVELLQLSVQQLRQLEAEAPLVALLLHKYVRSHG